MRNTNSSEYEAKHRYKGNVANNYDERRVSQPGWQREQEVFSKYLTLLPSGSSLIDVPLGTGRFIDVYKDLKLKVHGVDISEDMLTEARRKAHNIEYAMDFSRGDAEHLPQSNSECDFLICARLLNWVPIETLEGMIEEFIRVSKRGLILHIRVGRPLSAVEYLKHLGICLYKKPGTIWKPIVRRIFWARPVRFYVHNEDSIKNIFEKSGLRVIDKTVVGTAIKLSKGVYSESIVYYLGMNNGRL